MGNPDYKIEINELMLQVEKKFGRRLNVLNGFEEFALLLSSKLKSPKINEGTSRMSLTYNWD